MLLRALFSSAVVLVSIIPSLAATQLNRIDTSNSLDRLASPNHLPPAATDFSGLECPEPRGDERPSARWMSNAERFAKGFPPNPPKRRHPSRRHVAARTTPSPGPTTSTTGRIKVTDANGANLGYINKAYVSSGTKRFGITQSTSDALLIAVTYDSFLATVLAEVKMLNGPASTLPYLGFIPGPANTAPERDLVSGSHNYVFIVGIAEPGTLRGSSGSNTVANSYSTGVYAQSNVWTYNVAEKRLVPAWINSNLEPAAAETYTMGTSLIGTADLQKFEGSFSKVSAGPVRFILEAV
ncbi:hypothetical protein FA13DRAFT_1793898 [Coprinellus micaceus]|uniref:Uncharacterized protein n=1 Tax=Coprinellus micaceus TaxID=71717 RepID=A0A4Y7T2R3_COPMI|nr:hypothetical protein FA13DRAFT_1794281 [Coprinellus micaceus]TEB28415.1 hypothetical protein FA13DRAFT_1793898 [Coprinellus micaceus]